MTISSEQLAAYADGELPVEQIPAIEAAIAADPELARQVEAHRALKTMLGAHFAPIAEQPVPDRLAALLRGAPEAEPAPAAVIDFAAAREARATRHLPRWTWVAGPALAASLALILVLGPGKSGTGTYADAQLAAALDTRLSSDAVASGQPRILLSFAREDGELCRAYAGEAESGIACRDAQGWRLERQGAGVAGGGSDYRQAGSPLEELMTAAQDMASAGALDPDAEAEARKRGWR